MSAEMRNRGDTVNKSVQLKHLAEIEIEKIVSLLNHSEVRALMPLAGEPADADSAKAWVESKEKCWEECNYGPYAVVIGGEFAGWGGLQPENGEPDLALVLFPEFWGMGGNVFRALINEIARSPEIQEVTVHFPVIRKNRNAIEKLGFAREDTVLLDGHSFVRYRLKLAKENVL